MALDMAPSGIVKPTEKLRLERADGEDYLDTPRHLRNPVRCLPEAR